MTPGNSERKLLRSSRGCVCVWFIRAARHPLLGTDRPSAALSATTPLTPLRPDWDLWAYITSINCPAATSSELCLPRSSDKHVTSVSFVLSSSFWADIERDRGRGNEHGHKKLVAWQSVFVYTVDSATKEGYGWQHGERRGERMWEGQQWFGTNRGEEEHRTK